MHDANDLHMIDTQEWEERTRKRLRTHLQVHVPPAIRSYLRKGGPNGEDYARIRGYATQIGRHGDTILFPNGKGDDREHLEALVDGVAVLAFSPGGIKLFGIHFDAASMQDDPVEDNELHRLIADFDRILGLTPSAGTEVSP